MTAHWDTAHKCMPPEQLLAVASGLPRPLVFTNGVFDLLHPGHVACLELAREQGSALVVALNTDASARGLSKPGWDGARPVNPLRDRVRVMAGLACVSWVTWFDDPTPAALLQALKPEVYTKGGDYSEATLPETPLLAAWGGRVAILPRVGGHSSTALLQRIGGSDERA